MGHPHISHLPLNMMASVWTIGYEGKTLEAYLHELTINGVKVLCDVRRNPISRKKGFSKTALSEALAGRGVEYRHYPDLGISSALRKNLKTDEDRQRLFCSYRHNIKADHPDVTAIREIASSRRVALTCFEADHSMCHRHCIAELVSPNETVHI